MAKKKIAYLILAHTDPRHLERLVNAIDYQAKIFIHVDKKSDIQPFKALKLPSSASFIDERVEIYWAGISMVEATVNLIKSALKSDERYSHIVLLSGSDYPIKSPVEIYEFLNQNQSKQFIRFCHIKLMKPGLDRIEKYWFHDPLTPLPFSIDKYLRKILARTLDTVFIRKKMKQLVPTFGSQWWALTPDCASYLVETLDNDMSILKFFRYSHAPDEVLFHTLIANSPYAQDAGGFVSNVEAPRQLANLHIIKIHKIFSDKDFPVVQKSKFFFVRKVTSKDSAKLIDLIDEKILGKLQQSVD